MTAATVSDTTLAQTKDAVHLVHILARALEVLSTRAKWTRGAMARSLLHDAVPPTSDLAVCWSASGAVALALRDILGPSAGLCDRERLYDLGIGVLWRSLPADHPRTQRMILDIDGFNDYPGADYQDIVRMFEDALHSARCAPSSSPTEMPTPPRARR
jgi:hypothetical protein